EVVAGAMRLRARLAEPGDRAVDEPWVQAREGAVPEAELVHRPGPEVLEEHVALAHQRAEDLPTLGRLEVQRHALLVPVDGHEVGRLTADERWPTAGVVALTRLLDLDHLGAHVAERHRAEGTGENPGEVEHANSGQRSTGFRHEFVLSSLIARLGRRGPSPATPCSAHRVTSHPTSPAMALGARSRGEPQIAGRCRKGQLPTRRSAGGVGAAVAPRRRGPG